MYLSRKVQLLISVISLLPSLALAHQSVNDSIDRYLPLEVEKRPWTDPSDLQIKEKVPLSFMELTFRDFQEECDGQCFFRSADSANFQCIPKDKDCEVGISIARHGSKQCSFIGSAIGASLNHTICNPADQFYTISIVRRVYEKSCESHWNFELRMPCIPSEFIAISFYDDGDDTLRDKDRWYVCVAGEPFVSYWENVATGATRIELTSPYPNVASGVISSYQSFVEESDGFACQFVLSALEMSKDPLASVKFPLTPTYSGPDIKIKYAQGRVTRNQVQKIPESLLQPQFYDESGGGGRKSPEVINEEKEYFETQQALVGPEFSPSAGPVDQSQFLFANKFTGPDESKIEFSKLNIQFVSIMSIPSEDDDKNTLKDIKDEIAKCDSDTFKGRVKCFAPNGQRNCIYRERCPVMIIVEKNKKIKFRLISFQATFAAAKKVLRPFGWAAVAFSKDDRMGGDVVVACQFTGDESGIVVAWNGNHVQYLDLNSNQDLISNIGELKFIRKQVNDLYMCEWEMDSKFTIEISTYPGQKFAKDVDGNNITEVHFDLETDNFLLIALGSRIYKDKRMGYHSFRQTLHEKLNLKTFNSTWKLFNPNYSITFLTLTTILSLL